MTVEGKKGYIIKKMINLSLVYRKQLTFFALLKSIIGSSYHETFIPEGSDSYVVTNFWNKRIGVNIFLRQRRKLKK